MTGVLHAPKNDSYFTINFKVYTNAVIDRHYRYRAIAKSGQEQHTANHFTLPAPKVELKKRDAPFYDSNANKMGGKLKKAQ